MTEHTSSSGSPDTADQNQRILRTAEGKLLIFGLALAAVYFGVVALTYFWSPDLFHKLLTMSVTHLVSGRANAMLSGYTQQLASWLVIVANMVIETYIVLIFYPLFVLFYRHLFVINSLRDSMQRIRRTAERMQPKIMKYGIPGLLLFVWFPFWMTGPVVGSIIGFLIGLRLWVNLSVVLLGTYVAILCWHILMEKLYRVLDSIGFYVPFLAVSIILLFVIALHIRYAFANHEGGNKGPPRDEF